MSEQQRDVLKLTPEQFEDVEYDKSIWKDVHKEHFDKRRWFDVWKYVVQNVESGKYYEYYIEVYSGDGEGDSPDEYELTEVFPHTVETIIYK